MRFLVPVVLGLALAIPVAAVWTEPAVPLPGGTPAEPIRAVGDQTKVGSLELAGGATVTGIAAAASEFRSALYGIGAYRTSSTVSAGVFGRASGTAVPDTANPDPLQVGVYGAAGSDTSNAVGVYGDAAGFTNAWAGYFIGGTTGFGGSLALTGGGGNLFGYSGGTFTAGSDPTAVVATSRTSGKAGVYGSLKVDGSPGGEGAGVLGAIDTVVPDCTTANCSGVVGADTDSFTLRNGRWGGYFVGNVRLTGRLYLNGKLTAPPVALTDPQTYGVPGLTQLPPGSLEGLVAQTGGATDATGGVTSTQTHLIVTDYLGNDNDIARINPATLRPDSAADVVTLANPAQQVTYDGQDIWARSNDTLRRYDGLTLAAKGSWTWSSGIPSTQHTLDSAQPYARGKRTFIGTRRNLLDNNALLGWVDQDDSSTNSNLEGAADCEATRYVTSAGNSIWFGIPREPCGNFTTTVLRFDLNTSESVTTAGYFELGVQGNATAFAYDGTDLWISTQRNRAPAGDQANTEVHLLRVNPAAPTSILTNLTLPNTVGYTSGPVVFDGTAVWVSASTFGTNGFGYDGKLFRIPIATGVATEIDRSTTAVGNSPIQDLYFDGSDIYLYGYNPDAAPRINYYLEKRAR